MFIYLMRSCLVLSLWLSWLMCAWTTSSLCVCAPGWLWRPSSVLPRWCQLPVRGDQLGRRVRPLRETWSVHQSVELPGLDPLSHLPQEHSFMSEDHSLCRTWRYIVFGVLIIYEMPLKNWNCIFYCEPFLLTEYTFTETLSVFFSNGVNAITVQIHLSGYSICNNISFISYPWWWGGVNVEYVSFSSFIKCLFMSWLTTWQNV